MNDNEAWRSRGYLQQMRQDGNGFVVLGVGTGIGGEICRALREAGAELIVVDLHAAVAEAAAQTHGATPVVADVTDRADMQRVFDTAQARFGKRFTGVVDVVGIAIPGAIPAMDDQQIQRQFDLVLRHALLALQIAGPLLGGNGGGSITMIGSLAGLRSTKRVALYGAAKAALHHLVECAADELGPLGVRVNCVAPGRIAASGTIAANLQAQQRIEAAIPLRRLGLPSDIAGAALFLASELAGYLTGNVVVVDGGISKVSALPSSLT